MKKIIIGLYLLSLFLLPGLAQAQVDQRCWIKEDCLEFREGLVDTTEVSEGFYSASKHKDALAACGTEKDVADRELGLCLPAGTAVTNINFGGKTEFSNIVDFIQYIYRYGFMIGSVVAVAMIILGGIIWTFSGGSPEMITKAQKKIGGALMGLVLLALSYSILNLVNPYLVNLRLPTIWAINTQGLVPPWCRTLSETDKLALAINANENIDEKKISELKTERYKIAKFDTSPKQTVCGNEYFKDKSGGLTCKGHSCEETNDGVCARQFDESKSRCHEGVIAGNIYNSNIIDGMDEAMIQTVTEGWEFPWVEGIGDDIELCAICNTYNGVPLNNPDAFTTNIVADTQVDNSALKKQWYALKGDKADIIKKAQSICSHFDGLKGFLLDVEFNESWDPSSEVAYLGNNGGRSTLVGIASNIKEKQIKKQMSESFFITTEQIMSGYQIDINVARIQDED